MKGFIFLAAFASFHHVEGSCQAAESCLREDLLSYYDPLAKPRRNASEHVAVDVKFELKYLQGLDDSNGIMKFAGVFNSEWTDEFLQWNSENYSAIDEINVLSSDIWLPDLYIVNSVDQFLQSSFRERSAVKVNENGTVSWEIEGISSTSCNMFKLNYFPFDEHKCIILLGVRNRHANHVTLHQARSLTSKDFFNHPEWRLLKTNVKFKRSENGMVMKLTYKWKRQDYFYVVNFVLQAIILIIILLCTMFIHDPNDRLRLAIGLLLAFTVLQSIFADHTPKGIGGLPVLSMFILEMILMSLLVVIYTVRFINVPNREYRLAPERRYRVLKWSKRVSSFYGGYYLEKLQKLYEENNLTETGDVDEQHVIGSNSKTAKSLRNNKLHPENIANSKLFGRRNQGHYVTYVSYVNLRNNKVDPENNVNNKPFEERSQGDSESASVKEPNNDAPKDVLKAEWMLFVVCLDGIYFVMVLSLVVIYSSFSYFYA